MNATQTASILAVGLSREIHREGMLHADSGTAAIEMLRMLRFDLLLLSTDLPDMPVWHFVQRVRAAWPWQKWALVAMELRPDEEIIARTLGVVSILEKNPQLSEQVGLIVDQLQRKSERTARINLGLLADNPPRTRTAAQRR